MSQQAESMGSSGNRRRWLVGLSVAFVWVFFGSRYLYFPLYLVHQAAPGSEPLLRWLYMVLYLLDWPFTYLGVYVGLSVLGLALAVAALVWGRPGWPGRIALAVGLLGIIALPAVFRYEPAVDVDPGYVMRVPTEPGLLAGVVKATQTGAEVRRCEYELLGWSGSEGALYGEEVCGGRTVSWAYWPASDDYVREVPTIPEDLVGEQVTELPGVHSVLAGAESLVVLQPVLRSPDGERHAFVARHIYGPEDVVVVSSGPRAP